MKKLVLVLCVALITMSVSAQESFSFRKGYRGDVSLGGSVGVTKEVRNDAFMFSTTVSPAVWPVAETVTVSRLTSASHTVQ